MKIKGVIKNFIIKNDNSKIYHKIYSKIYSKIYLGASLELLRAVWGQFSFR